ncbi:uncharacterized protein LOC126824641 isoform X2 [Patella vulgata]|uniref:uncharacterized protein LOC126824641 isoform X2 n=1 Tax=Patella vulgata TaxID=6465 RepID=UPI0021805DA6|nr:uncharacterized protein LOC126824641 isoform X2 [Patella vulgata]
MTTIVSDHRKKHRNQRFDNDVEWRNMNRPIQTVYDVSNTTTQLILLNNRCGKYDNRLRGQSAKSRSIVLPDPIRHFSTEYPCDRRVHQKCFNEDPEMMKSHPKTALAWTNDTQRPAMKFSDDTAVNNRRHTSCQHHDPIDYNLTQPRRRKKRVLSEKVLSKSVAYCPDLTNGENLYLYNISRIYSTKNLQTINQNKYATVLDKEERRGLYNKRDIDKYWKYLKSPRQTNLSIGRSSYSLTPLRQRKKSKKKIKRNEDNQKGRDNDAPETNHLVDAKDNKHNSDETESKNQDPDDQQRDKDTCSDSYRSTSSRSRSRSSSSSGSSSSSSSRSSSSRKPRKNGDNRASDDEERAKGVEDGDKRASDVEDYKPTLDTRANNASDEDSSRGKNSESLQSNDNDRGEDYDKREGHGRPKSRFGRITVMTRDNSDDDYDTDSSDSTNSISDSRQRNNRPVIDGKIEGSPTNSTKSEQLKDQDKTLQNAEQKPDENTKEENRERSLNDVSEANEPNAEDQPENISKSESLDQNNDDPSKPTEPQTNQSINAGEAERQTPPQEQPINPGESSSVKELSDQNPKSARNINLKSNTKTNDQLKSKKFNRKNSETSSWKSSYSASSKYKTLSSTSSRRSNSSISSTRRTTRGDSKPKKESSVIKGSSSVDDGTKTKNDTAEEVASKVPFRSVSIDSHLSKRMAENESFNGPSNDVDKIEY